LLSHPDADVDRLALPERLARRVRRARALAGRLSPRPPPGAAAEAEREGLLRGG